MEQNSQTRSRTGAAAAGRRRATPLSPGLSRRLSRRLGLPQVFEAFGVRFAIRISDAVMAEPEVSAKLEEYLPCETRSVRAEELETSGGSVVCYAVRQRPDGSVWRLLRDRRVVLERSDLETVLHCLRGLLVAYVGERAPERVFVHAGAVGWKGRGIVLPGNSFAGKTTLTAALVRAGATYYSDEVAVLDEDGRLHPYARALQMRSPGRPEQRTMTIQELQGKAGRQPLPVGLVVYSQFKAEAKWRVKVLTPGMAVMEAMRHTFPVRQAPARVMRTWSRVAEGAVACKWTRGDADEAAQKLLRAVESGTVPA